MNTDTLQRPAMTPATPVPSPVQSSPSPYQEVKEATSEQVRHAATELKETGTEALQSAKAAGNDFVHEQKERFAAKIDTYTEAVKAACESLAEGDGNLLTVPAQRASQQMAKASDYLRNHDAMDFLHDLGELARRRPEIVFGGLFVAGLASVRFLKASSRDRPSANSGNDYPRASYVSAQQTRLSPSPSSNNGHLNQPILNPNQLK